MSPLWRGLVIAAVQVALVAGVGGTLIYDRETLPRVWVPTTGVDPVLPIRGRYASLRIVVDVDPGSVPAAKVDEEVPAGLFFGRVAPAAVSIVDGRLHATFIDEPEEDFLGWEGPTVQEVSTPTGKLWTLAEPIAFFLPEDVPDPTRLAPGETLWAEVTVPPDGAPRPIRLEVRR
jgi:hypothetical protein